MKKRKELISTWDYFKEFMIVYGWAILVVLVAIGALAYFGVLSTDKFIDENRESPIKEVNPCDNFICYYTSESGSTSNINVHRNSCPIKYQELDLFYVECVEVKE